jgi:hypothetical protein
MQKIIRLNGHLVLDGDETTEDLRIALIFLSVSHPPEQCKWPEYVVPIDKLIPDISVLQPGKSTKSRRVTNVDLSDENL